MERNSYFNHIQELLKTYASVDLTALDQVKLQNRIDTKFVLHSRDFIDILASIKDQYLVLEIEQKRIHAYESLYFDTEAYDLYYMHHNERSERIKVRYRKYIDSGLCYFEIKVKEKSNRTNKIRQRRMDIATNLLQEDNALIAAHSAAVRQLEKKLWVYFDRITLVNRNFDERITLDLNIRFDDEKSQLAFPSIVVCEIKQEKSNANSVIVKACIKKYYDQTGFSKYSIATAMMAGVRSNNFKPNINKINKIING